MGYEVGGLGRAVRREPQRPLEVCAVQLGPEVAEELPVVGP